MTYLKSRKIYFVNVRTNLFTLAGMSSLNLFYMWLTGSNVYKLFFTKFRYTELFKFLLILKEFIGGKSFKAKTINNFFLYSPSVQSYCIFYVDATFIMVSVHFYNVKQLISSYHAV